jgi:hypothetical protein
MQLPPSPRPSRSRRRFPRIEVLGLVNGRRVPLDVPLTVLDLCQGGFSIESRVPFAPGSYHPFRLTTSADDQLTLTATVVHCRLASAGADGQFTYISGLEFHSDDASDPSIAALVDTISSALAVE